MSRSRSRSETPLRAGLTLVGFALVFAALAIAAGSSAREPGEGAPRCQCELRSWVVAGRGRHLFLEVDCPEGHEELDGVIEFTTAALRLDYRAALDERAPPRVARASRGHPLRPAFGTGDERLEARYEVGVEIARELQRDRVFTEPYHLLSTNSTSGLRAAMEAAGLALPNRVLRGGGVLGEFPGVDFDPGDEIPAHEWRAHGMLSGSKAPHPPR